MKNNIYYKVEIRMNFNGRDIADSITCQQVRFNQKDAEELGNFYKKTFPGAEVTVYSITQTEISDN